MIFYPGSFTPPHKGHFNNIKYLLKYYPKQEITIIISKKIRPTNPDFYNLKNKSAIKIKELCNKYKINYKTKIDAIQLLEKYILQKKEYISSEDSLKICNIYLKKL